MNKLYLFVFSFLLITGTSLAQSFESPQIAFNEAANDYVFEGENQAISTLNRALKEYPDDEKLRALLEKILKDRQQKQQQDQQQNKNQNEKKENEQKSENQKEQEQKEQEEKSKQEQSEQQKQEQEQKEKQDQKSAEEKEGKPEGQQQEKAKKSDEEKDEKEIPQINPSDMEELNISPEKARMILEAMKNNEIQYLQQMQRRPTKRPDSNEPDW